MKRLWFKQGQSRVPTSNVAFQASAPMHWQLCTRGLPTPKATVRQVQYKNQANHQGFFFSMQCYFRLTESHLETILLGTPTTLRTQSASGSRSARKSLRNIAHPV